MQSKPSGAEVRLDGKRVCKTPCDVSLPVGESRSYKLVRKGYRTSNISLPKDGEDGKVFQVLRAKRSKVKLQTGWEG